ncbi:MAG: enolase C-terminal domain-like protein [Thermoplasmata archaeon]
MIVIILTDCNVIGIGEGTPYGTDVASDYRKIHNLIKKISKGDLYDYLYNIKKYEIMELSKEKHINFGAYLALESAILSAIALSKKLSIAEILGGYYRSEIPVTGTVFLDEPKKMFQIALKYVEVGITHIKFKIPCNLTDLERWVTIIGSLKSMYEKLVLRADANECFNSLYKATKALSILVRNNIDIIEQPMPRDKLKEMAYLKKRFSQSIEFMIDESLRSPYDLELFASIELADSINFHPSKLGCLSITRENLLKAQDLGFKVNIGSSLMTEIGLWHYLNLAASIPMLDYPLEEIGLLNIYRYWYGKDLLSPKHENFKILNGKIKLSSPQNFNYKLLRNNILNKKELYKKLLYQFLHEVGAYFSKLGNKYRFRL